MGVKARTAKLRAGQQQRQLRRVLYICELSKDANFITYCVPVKQGRVLQ